MAKHPPSKIRKRSQRSKTWKKIWLERKALSERVIETSSQPTGSVVTDPVSICVTEQGSDNNNVCTDPWDPKNEYGSIMSHQLDIEQDNSENVTVLKGNRIVDINFLLTTTLEIQYKHANKCTFGLLKLHHEKHNGLRSTFTLKCSVCDKYFIVHSEKEQKPFATVNVELVWGTLTTGSTYEQVKDLFTVMDIPIMAYSAFHKIEESLGDHWKDEVWGSMERAGKEELRLAIEKKQFSEDGIPWITVHCDGGWSKRSYGHSYNALSGTAVVIGKETGMVLFVGVRNKYCCICNRAANMKQFPREHRCFKNWEGSSTSMEADILVEAFNNSIAMHGVKYLKMIADGDSSVYSKIKSNVSYGIQVEKIECVNHLIKNVGKSLFKLKTATTDNEVSSLARKILTTEKIKKIQQLIMYSAKRNENAELLKTDIMNFIYHVYGDHSNCASNYCNTPGFINNNLKNMFFESGLVYHLKRIMESVLAKAHKLVAYENNNKAEVFMSILAKFNCGKRLNLIQKRSYEVRSYLSALKYNSGLGWQSESFRKFTGLEINDIFLYHMEKNHEMKRKGKKSYKKRRQHIKYADTDYGESAQQALLNATEFNSEYNRILQSLQVTDEQQWQLAIATIGQFSNVIYVQERKKRVTASNFGAIIKRRVNSSCRPLLKKIMLHKNITSPAIEYGKLYEDVARKRFEEETGIPVQNAGLFVDTEYGFLAASPDGLVGDDAILEIKCAYSLHMKKQSLESAIKDKKLFYMTKNKLSGQPALKVNHNYFYQIQGQLHITKREICYFVIYIDDDHPIFIQKIKRDENFWQFKMLPKLKKFYQQCFLPELIQGFIARGIECTHQY